MSWIDDPMFARLHGSRFAQLVRAAGRAQSAMYYRLNRLDVEPTGMVLLAISASTRHGALAQAALRRARIDYQKATEPC